MRWMNGVLSDTDVKITAELMLRHYKEDAASRAVACADELRVRGNRPGYDIWKRVIRVIGEIEQPSANQ